MITKASGLTLSMSGTGRSSRRSAAAGEAGLTAGLSVGCDVDGLQAWGGQAGVEQEAGGHTGLRNVAGWGAVVTAGWLQQPSGVWAGAGQADSTPAAFVRGADGGGGTSRDAAAAGSTASHGGGSVVCFWFLRNKDEVSEMQMSPLALGLLYTLPNGCWSNQKTSSLFLLYHCFPPRFSNQFGIYLSTKSSCPY